MKYRIAAVRTLGVVAIMAMAYLAGTGGATADNAAYSGVSTAIGGQAGLYAATATGTTPVAGATPLAAADSFSVAPGDTLAANVLENDTNAGSARPVGAWNGPGTLTLTPLGSFTYTAPAGSSGAYTFSYVALNGTLQSNTATVTITISPATSGGVVALDGRAIYNAASCSSCHGTDGVGFLSLSTTTMSNQAFFDKIETGSMAAYKGALTTAEVQAIADYFVPPPPPATTTTTTTTAPATSTTTSTTVAPTTSTTAAPATGGPDGAALFAASCSACHGSTVSTGLSNAGVLAKLTTGSMATYAKTGGTSWTALERQAVADFVKPPAPPSTTPTTAPPGTTPPGTTPPSTTPPAAPGTGASVYNAYCAACHGSDLTGSPMGPGIIGESRSEIAKVVRKGDGTMPAFNSAVLSDKSLAMLTDYIGTFGSKGGHGDGHGGDGDDDHGTTTTTTTPAAIGSSVYTSYCAACHGADGTGTNLGPNIAGEKTGETLDVVRSGDDGMPAFSATMLSDADLAAVADYVAALDGGGDGGHRGHGGDSHKKSKGHDKDDD